MSRRVRVHVSALFGAVVLVLSAVLLSTGSASAQVAPNQWNLTSFCTQAQSFPEFRRFRVRNSTGAEREATLRNQNTNASITFTAPAGDSFQFVPASSNPSDGNTTQLIIDGVTVATKAANNKACSTLVGNAVCDTESGEYDVTWNLRNNGTDSFAITGTSVPGLAFSSTTVPANATSTATEVVAAATSGTIERTLKVTVDLGSSVIDNSTAMVTLGQCEKPIPPRVEITFTKTSDVTEVDVGDTITYTYAGENTGEVALEVTGLVDDRLGVLSETDVETIIAPGGSLVRSIEYVATADDATIGTVDNAAVLTVVPQSGPDLEPRTATSTASVSVRPPPRPALVANQVCDPESPGSATITWTLANAGPGPAVITGSNRAGVLGSGTVAADDSLSAIEVVQTPDSGVDMLLLTVDVRGVEPLTTSVTVAPCLERTLDFTFTKTADVVNALPGDVVTYTYTGVNNGTADLDVLQIADDRLGVVDPGTTTTVPGGGGRIEQTLAYTVTGSDQTVGSVVNNAVATVRATAEPDEEPTARVASFEVEVAPAPPAARSALVGNAVCRADAGEYTITWTLGNGGDADAVVASATRPDTFAVGDTVGPSSSITAEEVVTAPDGSSTTVDLVVGLVGEESQTAAVVLGECRAPDALLPSFTLTKTADRPQIGAGETVTYTYTGTNTGEVALDVVQIVDDRLGIVLFDPGAPTGLAAGESVTRTLPYVVTLDDAAVGSIINHATATIRGVNGDDEFTAASGVVVSVTPVPDPVDPPQPDPTTTTTTTTLVPSPSTPVATVPTANSIRPFVPTPPRALPRVGSHGTAMLLTVGSVAAATGLVMLLLARRRTRPVPSQ